MSTTEDRHQENDTITLMDKPLNEKIFSFVFFRGTHAPCMLQNVEGELGSVKFPILFRTSSLWVTPNYNVQDTITLGPWGKVGVENYTVSCVNPLRQFEVLPPRW